MMPTNGCQQMDAKTNRCQLKWMPTNGCQSMDATLIDANNMDAEK